MNRAQVYTTVIERAKQASEFEGRDNEFSEEHLGSVNEHYSELRNGVDANSYRYIAYPFLMWACEADSAIPTVDVHLLQHLDDRCSSKVDLVSIAISRDIIMEWRASDMLSNDEEKFCTVQHIIQSDGATKASAPVG
ncbi:unnamed protein product [Taenia asiatica]|uniref:Uncharacterized protein n=1 Tax=Taenia asiatica TaxID=60517 RepID=A0A0R3W815_TAEAS|nr:unnamed protein product [Taenia asiatica]